LSLEELVRRGAREIIQRAIEVEALLAQFDGMRLFDGRRAVVRNGMLPAREILTAVGPVPVEALRACTAIRAPQRAGRRGAAVAVPQGRLRR